MLLTEEEAKKRWCPMARVSIGGKLPSSMNRLQTIGKDSDGETVTEGKLRLPVGARCIASECMAWRWREDRLQNVEQEAAEKLVAEGWQAVAFRLVGPRGLHTKVCTLTRKTDHGYCGLSGSPEKP